MAVLTAEQLVRVRRSLDEENVVPVTWTKPQVNAAVQALEDWWEANRAAAVTAMNAAASLQGKTFTNAELRQIAKLWLKIKFDSGG